MHADLIISNGNIVTMDAMVERCEALAIRDGRVMALGTGGDVARYRGPATRTVDAGGRMVLPGLNDTHIHLCIGGYYVGTMADLNGVDTASALEARLRAFAEENPDGWLMGVGWVNGVFTEATLDRKLLDTIEPDRPCLVFAYDVHSACLNSKACEAVGLTPAVEDPQNGRFSRYPDGTPTGMVHESALTWVQDRIPSISDVQYAEGVRFAQALCNRHGITSVLDPWITDLSARIYKAMASAGDLTLRVSGAVKIDPAETTGNAVERLEALRRDHCDEYFKIHSAKFFLDGVLENRTAAMIEDYQDAAGGNAPLMFDHSQIREMFTAFDAARFQIHVHVIGDAAVRAALDGLDAARTANGMWPSLHQLTHLQCVHPSDIARFGGLHCVANVQALWACYSAVTDVALPMVGPQRAESIFPLRSMVDAGAPWTLTSDWPVTSLNPFEIMETAVTRQPPGKRDHPVFLPGERITREQALKAYTVNAAAAAWQTDTGALSVGNRADLIITDRDILDCDIHALGGTQVLLTIAGGREVYRDQSFAG